MNNKGDIIRNMESIKADVDQVSHDIGAQIMKLNSEFSKDYDGDKYDPAIIQVTDHGIEGAGDSPRFRAHVLALEGGRYGWAESSIMSIVTLLTTDPEVRGLIREQKGILIDFVNEKGEKII